MDAIKRFILHASKSIFVAFADVSIQHQYSIASHAIKDISCVFIHILHIYQLMCHTDVLHDAKASHREILDGLKAGNVDQAVLGMGKHLDRISQYVNQYIPS